MTNKRNNNNLKLKSIWDENLISIILPNLRHRNKMWNWLIHHPHRELIDLPMNEWNFPKEAINIILNEFVKYTSTIIKQHSSIREDTVKLLIKLQDNHEIETVVIKHRNHTTVCVSSQIGCQMGCRFCATGTMGIIGDLTSAEILEQLSHANAVSKIRNVVFMGMGEPLQNYDNVKNAVLFMIDNQRYALSPRHVTVSTVGVVKNMYRLTEDIPAVNLALSLHAPNQQTRLKIVPTASAHKIDKLMAAIDNHIKRNSEVIPSHRLRVNNNNSKSPIYKSLKTNGVMIEYILIHNINDLEEHAHELGKLLSIRRDYILLNLIPYNPTDVAEDYHPPTSEAVKKFSDICRSEPYNIHTRVRQEMGQDIAGACGQLALVNKQKSNDIISYDIEDYPNSNQTKNINNNVNKLNESNSTAHSRLYITALTLLLPTIAIVLYSFKPNR